LQKTNTFFHLWVRLRPRAAQGDALAARERGFDAARKIVGRKAAPLPNSPLIKDQEACGH